jgi:ribosomal protein S2
MSDISLSQLLEAGVHFGQKHIAGTQKCFLYL